MCRNPENCTLPYGVSHGTCSCMAWAVHTLLSITAPTRESTMAQLGYRSTSKPSALCFCTVPLCQRNAKDRPFLCRAPQGAAVGELEVLLTRALPDANEFQPENAPMPQEAATVMFWAGQHGSRDSDLMRVCLDQVMAEAVPTTHKEFAMESYMRT